MWGFVCDFGPPWKKIDKAEKSEFLARFYPIILSTFFGSRKKARSADLAPKIGSGGQTKCVFGILAIFHTPWPNLGWVEPLYGPRHGQKSSKRPLTEKKGLTEII